MATNPNSAPAPKIPVSLLFDLEQHIHEVSNLQRLAELALRHVLDCTHPSLPNVEGKLALLVHKSDSDAVYQAVISASEASARLKLAWDSSCEAMRALNSGRP